MEKDNFNSQETSSENLSNEQNEWQKMAAEAQEFDKSAAEEAKAEAAKEARDQLVNQMENGETAAKRYNSFLKFMDSGDIEGYEKRAEKMIDWGMKEIPFLSSMGEISKQEHNNIFRTMSAYDRYIRKTLKGEDPEQATKERPKISERISSIANTDSSLKVIDYQKDQEEIRILKSLSPGAKKSLDTIVQWHKENPYIYNTGSHNISKQETGQQRPGENVELPAQGPNANSPLFNEYPYNPFQ